MENGIVIIWKVDGIEHHKTFEDRMKGMAFRDEIWEKHGTDTPISTTTPNAWKYCQEVKEKKEKEAKTIRELTDEEIKATVQELKRKYENFNGSEDDGIRSSLSAQIGEYQEVLYERCEHEFSEKTEEGTHHWATPTWARHEYTIRTCSKCGKVEREEIPNTEPIPEEALWR